MPTRFLLRGSLRWRLSVRLRRPISLHVGAAMDAGVTVEQIENILIAVAPIVGTPRVTDAALNVTEALGIVIAVLEDELEAEEEEAQ